MEGPEILLTQDKVPIRIKWQGVEWVTLATWRIGFLVAAILGFFLGLCGLLILHDIDVPTIKDTQDSEPTRIEWNDKTWVPELYPLSEEDESNGQPHN